MTNRRSKKSRAARTEVPDLGFELCHGPHGVHLCVREVEVGAASCEQHRGTDLDGFRPDGTPCLSRYDTPADREASWWEYGDEMVENLQRVYPGTGRRPWGFWTFSAASVCGHRPRCPLPPGAPWPADADALAWLAEHPGELSSRERVAARRTKGKG